MILDSVMKKEKNEFFDNKLNQKARKAFFELLKSCNFTHFYIGDKVEVKNISAEIVGRFLVVGANIGEKLVQIESRLLENADESDYVLVVLFDGEQVVNVFAFSAIDALKGKIHKYYKNSPKKGLVGIKIKKFNSKALLKQRFGVVLNKFIKIEEK